MAIGGTNWSGSGDSEKRQRILHELQQLKQMSKNLRTKAMRSFIKRAADERRARQPSVLPVKPPFAA
jgi:hypothetical protein